MLRQGLNLGSVCKSQAFCMMCCSLPLRSRDWCLLDYGQKTLWAGHQKHSAIFTYPFIPLVSRAKVLNDTCTASSIPQGASLVLSSGQVMDPLVDRSTGPIFYVPGTNPAASGHLFYTQYQPRGQSVCLLPPTHVI